MSELLNKFQTQKIVIEFSASQTAKYLEIVSRKTTAEIDDECLPSGVSIIIEVCPPFGEFANGNGHGLGEISVARVMHYR